jgi:type I restriction enzyme M protein
MSPPDAPALQIQSKDGKIYSSVRKTWLIETPEERVRQDYLCILVNDYGFSLDKIAEEENLTGRGSAQARADHVLWRSVKDKAERKPPLVIVEFMIRMLDPQEGETLCDPASGSGGFLIRFFELVREAILRDADRQYREYAEALEQDPGLDESARAERLRAKFDAIQATLDQKAEGSRLWQLANRCIYGTDKNDRMARTSKMNMIMHGDGHGGVHHWNGFLNVNGIFPGRFDLILTNPPFGAKVEADEKILAQEIELPAATERHYEGIYGAPYKEARAALKKEVNKPVAGLFTLPKGKGGKVGKIKTEILFVERCLELLKPGGRMGIVLPEGVFNNPSLAYVREFVEDRAYIRAVVSLPQETFYSSGASVKASLLFLERFSEETQAEFNRLKAEAQAETRERYRAEMAAERARLDSAIRAARAAQDTPAGKAAEKERAVYDKRMAARIALEARALLKRRFNYPVFLYEAEKVGLTATGEADDNELYPNERIPAGIGKTALELYREFHADPTPFFV